MFLRYAMLSVLACTIAAQSSGFEVGAIIREIDIDQRVASVFANGQDRKVKIAGDVKTLDEKGKDLRNGLAAKEFRKGATVTLDVQRVGNTMTIPNQCDSVA